MAVFQHLGIKFTIHHKNGAISTWNCTYDKPISEIINQYKSKKRWIGGRFDRIFLQIENTNIKYHELDIDVSKYQQLLKK